MIPTLQLGAMGRKMPAQSGFVSGPFPVLEDYVFTDLGSSGTSHIVSLPATVNAGDRLVIFIFLDGNPTINTPSGWTSVANVVNGSSSTRGAAFSKIAAGTEGGSTQTITTTTSTSGGAQCIRLSGVGAGAQGTGAAFNSLSTINPANLSPAWGSANTTWLLFAAAWDTQSVSQYPFPDTQNDDFASGKSFFYSSKQQAIATVNPDDLIISGASFGVTLTIGIQPANA